LIIEKKIKADAIEKKKSKRIIYENIEADIAIRFLTSAIDTQTHPTTTTRRAPCIVKKVTI